MRCSFVVVVDVTHPEQEVLTYSRPAKAMLSTCKLFISF
jgi:hypothetical protein